MKVRLGLCSFLGLGPSSVHVSCIFSLVYWWVREGQHFSKEHSTDLSLIMWCNDLQPCLELRPLHVEETSFTILLIGEWVKTCYYVRIQYSLVFGKSMLRTRPLQDTYLLFWSLQSVWCLRYSSRVKCNRDPDEGLLARSGPASGSGSMLTIASFPSPIITRCVQKYLSFRKAMKFCTWEWYAQFFCSCWARALPNPGALSVFLFNVICV